MSTGSRRRGKSRPEPVVSRRCCRRDGQGHLDPGYRVPVVVADGAADRLRDICAHVEVGAGSRVVVVALVGDADLRWPDDGTASEGSAGRRTRPGWRTRRSCTCRRPPGDGREGLVVRRHQGHRGVLDRAGGAARGDVGHRAADRPGPADEPGLVDREAHAAGEDEGEAAQPDVRLEPAAGAVGVEVSGGSTEGRGGRSQAGRSGPPA